MSTAPTGYQTPKTNWQSGSIPLPADFNRAEGNSAAIETGNRTIDQAQAPASSTGTLRQLLDWFANRIRAITGKTNWYDTPATTLEAAKGHIDAANNPHDVTAAQIGAETPAGAQAKVDTHAGNTNNPHNVTAAQIGAETPAGAQAKVDAYAENINKIEAKLLSLAFDGVITLPGYYKTTEFDKPSPGDITESLRLSADNSLFATRTTQFDTPAAGNITVIVECPELGIHNRIVTEFDTPTVGDIKETASEVI
jgi:hypothetical protein